MTAGVYRIVRHPGYVGTILSHLDAPLITGWVSALTPAGVAILLMVIRTFLEDRMLQEELDRYREYARKGRYRLAAGVS